MGFLSAIQKIMRTHYSGGARALEPPEKLGIGVQRLIDVVRAREPSPLQTSFIPSPFLTSFGSVFARLRRGGRGRERFLTSLGSIFPAIGVLCCFLTHTLQSQPDIIPAEIPYSGRIAVDGLHYNGTGFFKFAFVNGAGDTTYWSNDQTSVGGGEPTAAVQTPVESGRYQVVLGDSLISNMEALDPAALPPGDLFLKVWFSEDNSAYTLLTPDTRILPVFSALRAKIAETVVDGAIGPNQLVSGSVLSSEDPEDPALLGQGLVQFAVTGEDDQGWADGAAVDAPTARTDPGGVWTGSDLIIFGGGIGLSVYSQTGAVYHPPGDDWTATSTFAAPSARIQHSAVWDDSGEMHVWGGLSSEGYEDDGASLNPALNQWIALQTENAPTERGQHSAVWTGTAMVIWGGRNLGGAQGDGASWDPDTDAWAPVSAVNAPEARLKHTAVWTGTEMIIFGGLDAIGNPLANGARYDPVLDQWTTLSSVDAPEARSGHTAIWTGTAMVVWGGEGSGGALDTGASCDPVANTWTPLSQDGAPTARHSHSAVWSGTEMIIFGGTGGSGTRADGGRYDPVEDTWKPLPTNGTPVARKDHLAVWTGDAMLVFGGEDSEGVLLADLQIMTVGDIFYLYRKP